MEFKYDLNTTLAVLKEVATADTAEKREEREKKELSF